MKQITPFHFEANNKCCACLPYVYHNPVYRVISVITPYLFKINLNIVLPILP